MPEDGIVLGKDGSLMAGWVYEGEDESSRTDEEQALVSFRINEALKRLGNGWMLHRHFDAGRGGWISGARPFAFPRSGDRGDR